MDNQDNLNAYKLAVAERVRELFERVRELFLLYSDYGRSTAGENCCVSQLWECDF